MRKVFKYSASLLLTATFIGCGGGGGGGSSSDDGNVSKPTATKGVFYDDIVVGLDYKTEGFTGKTNDKGEFQYKSGKVEFYLQNLKIGEIPKMTDDKKVFLSDALNKPRGTYLDPKLVELAQLLQSLDTTPRDDGKIVLDQDKIKTLFATEQILSDVKFSSLSSTITVSDTDAKKEVKQTYIEQGVTPIEANSSTPPSTTLKAEAGKNIAVQVGKSFTLDGSNSTGTITEYEWLEGTTSLYKGAKYTTSYSAEGNHTLTLKVTDDKSKTATDSVKVTVTKNAPKNQPPTAAALTDVYEQVGYKIDLDGSKSTDSDGNITQYEWFFVNSSTKVEDSQYKGTDPKTSILLTAEMATKKYDQVALVVTDDKGATDRSVAKLTIDGTIRAKISPELFNPIAKIDLDTKVTFKFNQPMDETTLLSENFTLTADKSSRQKVKFKSANYDSATYTLTLEPDHILFPNSAYLLGVVENKVKSEIGNYYKITHALPYIYTPRPALRPDGDKGKIKKYLKDKKNDTSDSGIKPEFFADDDQKIVHDLSTGLTWENHEGLKQVTGDMKTALAGAKAHCSNLTLANVKWRVPTFYELMTLVSTGGLYVRLNFSDKYSFDNPTGFHTGKSAYIATSREYGDDDEAYLFAGDMVELLPVNNDDINYFQAEKYVRCVAESGSFKPNFDNVLEYKTNDNNVKLSWTYRKEDSKYPSEAAAYCDLSKVPTLMQFTTLMKSYDKVAKINGEQLDGKYNVRYVNGKYNIIKFDNGKFTGIQKAIDSSSYKTLCVSPF